MDAMDPPNESEEEEEKNGDVFQQCNGKGTGAKGEVQSFCKWKRGKGEMMQYVNGARIVRPTGRKDRHSKVCTARGTRDRRVRLSPNTAIQFYDVQDRLGYDRPSKALDWLMNEAKYEIDALKQSDHHPNNNNKEHRSTEQKQGLHPDSSNSTGAKESFSTDFYQSNCVPFHQDNNDTSSSSIFLYDVLQQGIFPSFHSNVDFEIESSKIQRLISWNSNPGNDETFTNLTPLCFPPFTGQNQVFSQREPLQSSNFPPISTHSFSYATMGFANNEISLARRIRGEAEEGQHINPTSLMDYHH